MFHRHSSAPKYLFSKKAPKFQKWVKFSTKLTKRLGHKAKSLSVCLSGLFSLDQTSTFLYLCAHCSSAITKVHCRGKRHSAVRTCIIFLQRRPIFWMGVFCLLLQNQVTTSESLLKRILWLGCHRSEYKTSFEENLQHQAI